MANMPASAASLYNTSCGIPKNSKFCPSNIDNNSALIIAPMPSIKKRRCGESDIVDANFFSDMLFRRILVIYVNVIKN
jgi:hypothetical protein